MNDGLANERLWRLAGHAAGLVLVAALAGLGWLWRLDRTRAWQSPGIGPPLELLRAAPPGPGGETWLVAVNPECVHCRQALARLVARARPGLHVGALVIDTPRCPGPAVVATLRCAPVWWDRKGDWRRRWGHRVYGETLCFDARGRYLRTRPPE